MSRRSLMATVTAIAAAAAVTLGLAPSSTAAPPPVATQSSTAGYEPGWGLPAWQDEFDGSSVDTSKWTVRDRSTHGNLSYDQGVISRDAVSVSNGALRIRATQLPEAEVSGGQTRWWRTGYLDTIGKQESQYGRWEFRAKLPTTSDDSRGVWPAFWLRNGDVGEIDIMESWGDPPTRSRSDSLTETSTVTLHESTNGGGRNLGTTYEHAAFPGQAPYDSASRWRTWTVEYTPEHFKAYLDGVLAVHIVPTGELVRGLERDFSWVWGPTFAEDPWAMRLNLQMGDPYWAPNISPSDLTVMPADFLVDYVRFWEVPDGPVDPPSDPVDPPSDPVDPSDPPAAPEPVETTLVESDASWRYRFDSTAWPSGWTSASFNDSAWKSGRATVGYGHSSVTTNIDAPVTSRHRTALFRHQFEVRNPQELSDVVLTTHADDGVAVWVNGTEVGRANLPSGTLGEGTYANAAPRTESALAQPLQFTIPVELLREGANVIAVSNHHNYRATPDRTFTATLEAIRTR